jgi:hypothetical protein
MNITFEPEIDPEPTTSDNRSRSRLVTTEFSEARHRLMLECRYAHALNKPVRAVQKGAGQHQIYAGSSEFLEEAFYWFLTAPALVYVVYLAFGF